MELFSAADNSSSVFNENYMNGTVLLSDELEALEKNPADLLEICRRVISEWQYLDSTVKQSQLVEVEQDVPLYRDSKISTKSGDEIAIPKSEQRRLTCTKLTIVDNYTFHEVRDLRNLKNFRGEGLELNLNFQDMETFYWLLRLQGRSAILPIAIVNMMPKLKQIGFTGWKLPSGELVR